MSQLSLLILVILATAVTSIPTKGSGAERGCLKGLLRRTLDGLRRVFRGQPATENATPTTENKHKTTGSNRDILQESQGGLVGATNVKRENVDDATLPTTHFNTAAEESNGEHTNWEQAKREFHDNYNAEDLPKSMSAKFSDFKVLKKIGKGSCGVVYKVVKKSDGQEYAMKTMKKANVDKDKVKHEKMLLYAVNSKYISKLRYYFEKGGTIYMVIDFVDGIELFYFVEGKERLSEDEARYFAADVVLAIEYLHNVGCIHHDIKLENIIIDRQCHCTVIDLGLAKLLLDKPTIQSNIADGTVYYAAPELLYCKPYGKPIDCWSFGVVLYAMVLGQLPFDGRKVDVIQLITEGYITYPKGVFVSDKFKNLISNLLKLNVEERYDINRIKEDPWFRQCLNGNEGCA